MKKPLNGIIITTPDLEKRVLEYDLKHGVVMDTFLNQTTKEIKEASILFYIFLFDKFRKSAKNDPKTYIITTAYCNVALALSEGEADAIIYPSVPFNGQGINFAINLDYVTGNNLELTHVFRNELKVLKNENGKHEFKESLIIEATGVDVKQNIIKW